MGWLYTARSWVIDHFDLIGPVFFACVVLIWTLPLLVVSMIGHRLPDAQTGYRRSDAFPIMPSAHFRSWAFLFGRRGLELSDPVGRGLIYLFRVLTVVVYVSLFVIFVAEVTDGFVFDPEAEILKSDVQRSEAAGR